mmetsp:Transcript_26156/g.84440  ORF Transcript_26156/g.84440 Transcript_26156/m.84440 type:complete len:350 (-) Transcript_26156:391-1440(-)
MQQEAHLVNPFNHLVSDCPRVNDAPAAARRRSVYTAARSRNVAAASSLLLKVRVCHPQLLGRERGHCTPEERQLPLLQPRIQLSGAHPLVHKVGGARRSNAPVRVDATEAHRAIGGNAGAADGRGRAREGARVAYATEVGRRIALLQDAAIRGEANLPAQLVEQDRPAEELEHLLGNHGARRVEVVEEREGSCEGRAAKTGQPTALHELGTSRAHKAPVAVQARVVSEWRGRRVGCRALQLPAEGVEGLVLPLVSPIHPEALQVGQSLQHATHRRRLRLVVVRLRALHVQHGSPIRAESLDGQRPASGCHKLGYEFICRRPLRGLRHGGSGGLRHATRRSDGLPRGHCC